MTPDEYAIYGLDATGRHKGGGRTHMRRLTVEQAQRVVDLHAAGASHGAIAREVGISHYPIWAILGGWHWTVREGHVRLPAEGAESRGARQGSALPPRPERAAAP